MRFFFFPRQKLFLKQGRLYFSDSSLALHLPLTDRGLLTFRTNELCSLKTGGFGSWPRLKSLQILLVQITGRREMAGRWGWRNSWVHPALSSMRLQTTSGRQSLSCSALRFPSGLSRPQLVPLLRDTSTSTASLCLLLLKSNAFKRHGCHFFRASRKSFC